MSNGFSVYIAGYKQKPPARIEISAEGFSATQEEMISRMNGSHFSTVMVKSQTLLTRVTLKYWRLVTFFEV